MLMTISCIIAVLRVVAVFQSLEQSEMSLISSPLVQSHHNMSAKVHVQVFDNSDTEPEDDDDFVIMENLVQVVGEKQISKWKFCYIKCS